METEMAEKKLSRLERLLEQQKSLEYQIKAERKRAEAREREAAEKRMLEVGELARAAGILDLSDDVLAREFSRIQDEANT
jgi:hypothetical protein